MPGGIRGVNSEPLAFVLKACPPINIIGACSFVSTTGWKIVVAKILKDSYQMARKAQACQPRF